MPKSESGPRATRRRIQDELEIADGSLILPSAKFRRWHVELATYAEADREELGVELLALARRLQRKLGVAAAMVVVQLCDLAAALLNGAIQAHRAGKQDRRAVTKLLGQERTAPAPRQEAAGVKAVFLPRGSAKKRPAKKKKR